MFRLETRAFLLRSIYKCDEYTTQCTPLEICGTKSIHEKRKKVEK